MKILYFVCVSFDVYENIHDWNVKFVFSLHCPPAQRRRDNETIRAKRWQLVGHACQALGGMLFSSACFLCA